MKWVEITLDNGEKRRMRLVWGGKDVFRFVFLSPQGLGEVSYQYSEFVSRLARGDAWLEAHKRPGNFNTTSFHLSHHDRPARHPRILTRIRADRRHPDVTDRASEPQQLQPQQLQTLICSARACAE